MSPRAACRLETLGFTKVHDYAAGKVDWLAHGLAVEGTDADQPTAGSLARHDAATCSLDDTAGEVLRRIDASPYGFALVLSARGVLLGRARRSGLQSAEPDALVESCMEPGPSTIRPHLTVEELHKRLARSEFKTFVVTTPGGSLLGVLRRDDVPS
ncbi:MAG TPA: CBS domain-containing protein [Solirubrobacteraceae bacterium]